MLEVDYSLEYKSIVNIMRKLYYSLEYAFKTEKHLCILGIKMHKFLFRMGITRLAYDDKYYR